MTEASLPDRLARAITLGGPIPVSQFMAAANAHYYATRDPFGTSGDFITAPEISQMFGELLAAWAFATWDGLGRPSPFTFAEAGPGRGTLMADIAAIFHWPPSEMDGWSLHELTAWRERARLRSGAE